MLGKLKEHLERESTSTDSSNQMPHLYEPTVSYSGLKVINLLPGNYFLHILSPITQWSTWEEKPFYTWWFNSCSVKYLLIGNDLTS